MEMVLTLIFHINLCWTIHYNTDAPPFHHLRSIPAWLVKLYFIHSYDSYVHHLKNLHCCGWVEL